MEHIEFEESVIYPLIDAVDYISGSVVMKSILRKSSGNVTIVSFDSGEIMHSKSSPFDNLIQIVEGEAEVHIEEKSIRMEAGQIMIIPANVKNSIKAIIRFKMLSTIIKSGYEDVSI